MTGQLVSFASQTASFSLQQSMLALLQTLPLTACQSHFTLTCEQDPMTFGLLYLRQRLILGLERRIHSFLKENHDLILENADSHTASEVMKNL